MEDTIAITTDDRESDILAAHNSAAWSLDLKRAAKMKYLVCVRKRGKDRQAFLICKIASFSQDFEATERSKGKRAKYAIEFEEYARLDEPAEWITSQNPVQFKNLADWLPQESIPRTFSKLPPKDANAPRYSYSNSLKNTAGRTVGMSVAEAKRALAARFGVPEEAITITIQA